MLRLSTGGLFLAVLGFCIFGFICTFEPMPLKQRWVWRTVYAFAGTASALGAVRPLRCQWRGMKRHAAVGH